jgi:manganese efflux pump family protein
MDALAVSLCAGASGFAFDLRARGRLAFHFGFFQAVMPVLGWVAGVTISRFIGGFDHWFVFGILLFIGARMIHSGLRPDTSVSACDPTRGSTLIMLSFATSLDALAVGFSFALLAVEIWWPAVVIGVVTFSLSFLAAGLGGRLNSAFGSRMEILGGIVLAVIGTRILLQHLFSL